MSKSQNIGKICNDVLSVSINWESLFQLELLSRTDSSVKEKYELELRKLIFLGKLSFDQKNNYTIDIPKSDGGGCANPKIDDKVLYIMNTGDAYKIKRQFAWSTICHYVE